MERSVFANYSAFIRRVAFAHSRAFLSSSSLSLHARRTAKEIADLQADLSRVRELLHGIGGVVTALRDCPGPGQGPRGATRGGARSPDAGMRRYVLSRVSTLPSYANSLPPLKHSFLALDLPLSPLAPASTAATEALVELTEQLEVQIGA